MLVRKARPSFSGTMRSRRCLLPWLYLSLLGMACAPVPTEDGDMASLQRKAILGGTLAPEDRAVFHLFTTYPDGEIALCSATLIGQRTLLTAAHCVQDRLINGQWRSGMSFAANRLHEAAVLAPQRLLGIERGVHPDWRPPSLNNDLALVLLEHPPMAPSKPWNLEPLTRLEGRTVRSLGYGVVDFERTGEGLRRQVMLSVQKVDSQHFQLSASASGGVCFGDSGGPTFHTFPDGVERLVGIHSTITLARECRTVTDTRVDAYRDFIQAWLEQRDEPRCEADTLCRPGCTPEDPDCLCQADGTCDPRCPAPGRDPDCPETCVRDRLCSTTVCDPPDPDCILVGSLCPTRERCMQRVCVNDAQNIQPYCSRPCTTSEDCPSTMECAQDGACRFRPLPVVAAGEECTPGQNICLLPTTCAGLLGDPLRCRQLCAADDDCPGTACITMDDRRGVCGDTLLPPPPEDVGNEKGGGCATTGGAGLPAPLLALLLALARDSKKRTRPVRQ